MARAFGEMGFGVDLIVLGGGPLLGSFREVATVHQIDLARQPRDDVLKLLHALKAHGADVAIANTVVSGLMVPLLREADFHTLSLVHELPGILKSYKLEAHAEAIASHAEKVVFPAEIVRSGFEAFVGRDLGDIAVIRPQGSYLQSPHRFVEDLGPIRRRMREELGLAADSRIVMSSGYADHRKGVDLFVESLLQVMQSDDKVVGLWIGHRDEALFAEQMTRIRESGRQSRFVFTGRIGNPEDYYAAADVFALTSREDPFPSVVLEAFEVRLPVVAFEGAGGSESLLRRGCGVIVPAFDTTRFAEAIGGLIENPARGAKLAATGYDIVLREFGFRHYLFDLLELAGRPLPKVSVVVPNYNYARYMGARLDSIVKQRIPIYELIVLDDCSKDDSVNVIRSLLANCPVSAPFVANKENSGSVFRQWARGVELARGDLVWIAEADDLSDRAFLKEVLPAFARSDVVMSYSQSRAIDGDGGVAFENYLHYVADIDPEKWTKPYTVAGTEEIREALFVKNTIPNVSSVVFRREALQEVLRDHSKEILSYRNAGDWVVYLRLLEKGAIAFSPRALNLHRRHGGSVTVGNFNIRQLREIVRVQRETIERHGLGEDAQRAADAYAQKLYEQFGLATESSPRFDSHEGVMSDLRP
jgi:glycosyltransferase involved in cell wall biosynthesis